MKEILSFLSCVEETLPILFDRHFGGGEQFVRCLSYLLFNCIREENVDINPVFSLFLEIWQFIPYNEDFVIQCQHFLQLEPSTDCMKCILIQCQHTLPTFIQTNQSMDITSSLIVRLANQSPSEANEDEFHTILWQFIEKVILQHDYQSVFYLSDMMVLIDITLRNIQNNEPTHKVQNDIL